MQRLRVFHAQSVRAAAKAISVPADVCAFASTYSGSAQRAADELVAPSFCEEIAATADQISENQGFWSAPWRLLRAWRCGGYVMWGARACREVVGPVV